MQECIIKGCLNEKGQGKFVGDICSPCFDHITTGKVGPTTSFLKNIGRFSGFMVWDKIEKCLIDISPDGRGINSEDGQYDIYFFMITPNGGVVVWNDYQDYLVEDSDNKFKVVFREESK
jgi:hypothetical protein